MAESRPQTLTKAERISSKKQIDKLFSGGQSRSMSAYPLRMVYMVEELDAPVEGAQVAILVSVPKRCFKRAVKRNRVKRQIREAYRRNKYTIIDSVAGQPNFRVSLAFIWLSDTLAESKLVERRVCSLLTRVAEKI
uniref:Ribonuclease P protein component n=1 Tax=Prevotella sp. GTC17260 TaxID=3236796 RepID=A0AB33JIW4_9BACT